MKINYLTLAHSDNGIPTTDAVLGLVLKIVSKEVQISRASLIEETIKILNLPDNLLNITLSNGQTVIHNRIDWAISNLYSAKFLTRPSRGQYILSAKGKRFLDNYGLALPRNVVLSEINSNNFTSSDEKDESNEEILLNNLTLNDVKEWHTQQLAEFKDKLINYLHTLEPYQFEKLMVRLLEVMGYCGTDGQAITTQATRDGGIDGVIQQDALGLQNIYIQVKRYAKSNSVGSRTIQSFSGALQERSAGNSNSGVFITTSSYTQDALISAKRLHIKVIDGEQLAKLIIKYKVGIKTINQFPVYEINKDDF